MEERAMDIANKAVTVMKIAKVIILSMVCVSTMCAQSQDTVAREAPSSSVAKENKTLQAELERIF
jgi:hypothetical protein